MTTTPPRPAHRKPANRRILVVDDNPAIHADFQKILCPKRPEHHAIDSLEGLLFDDTGRHDDGVSYELHSAYQGQDALVLVRKSVESKNPFAVAFVDVRMPPGWDGIETIARLWEVDPSLQIVICTAYSDYSWNDMRAKLGQPESLVVLKKPFDNIEVQQLAHALTRKWDLTLEAQSATTQLAGVVSYMRSILGYNRNQRPPDTTVDTPPPPLPAEVIPAFLLPSTDGLAPLIDDATERLQLGEVLMRLKQTLETTVRQLRDTEVQLVQAEKMASLGRMAASIFHEINNPLNYTLMAVELTGRHGAALPENRRSEFQEGIRDIREGLVGISEIVQDLREFTHPQYGHIDTVDINQSITTALRLLAAELRDRIHIDNRVPAGFTVNGVRNRLTQVFLNLIQNSVDALGTKTFQNGERPEIRFEASDEDGARILRVRDNGPGIPEKNIGKVFEPFFTTKSVGRGTGLGLSICYRLLRDVGATISVHSQVDAYCEFVLRFPDHPDLPSDSPAAPIPDAPTI